MPDVTPNAVAAPKAITERRYDRRRKLLVAAVVVLLLGSGCLAMVEQTRRAALTAGAGERRLSQPVATIAIARRPLAAQTRVNGTLGYADRYSVIDHIGGYYTQLPRSGEGQIVEAGQVLYRVGARPVVLLDGTSPAWREMRVGDSGTDVAQLNANLVKLGLLDPAAPTRPDTFGPATERAVRALQKRVGATPTGSLSMGDVVFLPAPIRIVTVTPELGELGVPGRRIMEATSTRRVVTAQLTPSERALVDVGVAVEVTLNRGTPAEQVLQGVISRVDTVATVSSGGAATFGIEITPNDPEALGPYDQLPVQVSITKEKVADALVVPVTALLAVAGKGYAVELVDPGGEHRIMPVQLGIFNDVSGLVQVSGTGLEAGQRVVVPSL